MHRRKINVTHIAAAVGLALLVSSCGGTHDGPAVDPSGPPPQDVADTPSSTRAAPSTPAAPPVIRLDELEWAPLGPFIAYKGIAHNTLPDSVLDAATLFHPRFGVFKVDAERVLPNSEVLAQSWVGTGTKNEPGLAGIVEVRKPATGMEPEYVSFRLVVLDPENLAILSDTEVHRMKSRGGSLVWNQATLGLAGSDSDVIAVTLPAASPAGGEATIAYDLSTGREVWRLDGRIDSAVTGGLALVQQYPDPQFPSNTCERVSFVEVVTGKEVLVETGEGHRTTSPSLCQELPTGSYAAGRVLSLSYALDSYGRREVIAYSFADSAPKTIGVETVAIDPSSGLALSVPTRDGLGNYRNDLVVTDTATGTIVHSIEKARATSLGLTVQALLDDKIWVTTTDQKLVLSARTGDIVESGWTGYPLVANDSGVVYSDGRFVERA